MVRIMSDQKIQPTQHLVSYDSKTRKKHPTPNTMKPKASNSSASTYLFYFILSHDNNCFKVPSVYDSQAYSMVCPDLISLSTVFLLM